MKINTIKKSLFLILLSTSSVAFAAQYTNFTGPSYIPSGLQSGTLNFTYSTGRGNFNCAGPVATLLQYCLNNLNRTINTATFNGEPIFGTAHLTLTCSNNEKSYLSVGPDIIQQPNNWITLEVPPNCG